MKKINKEENWQLKVNFSLSRNSLNHDANVHEARQNDGNLSDFPYILPSPLQPPDRFCVFTYEIKFLSYTHTPQTFTLLSLPLYLSLSLFRVSTTAQQPLKISTTNKSIKKKAQQQQAETT